MLKMKGELSEREERLRQRFDLSAMALQQWRYSCSKGNAWQLTAFGQRSWRWKRKQQLAERNFRKNFQADSLLPLRAKVEWRETAQRVIHEEQQPPAEFVQMFGVAVLHTNRNEMMALDGFGGLQYCNKCRS